jgi:hypothetical protein
MTAAHWIVAALALVEAAWMTFDGARALIVGDYVTPKSGADAGQLGPWTKIVKAVGIEPRSTLMKSVFLIYGLAWLIIVTCFVLGWPWTKPAMIAAAVGTLWFIPIGTTFSVIQLALLLAVIK